MIVMIRALVIAWVGVGLGVPAIRAQTAGAPAADFTLQTLAGESLTLSRLKGHPVLLNFWATWCVPCRAEMPDIDVAYRAHHAQGLEVLAINLADVDRLMDVLKFVREHTLTLTVLLDERGMVWRRYAARGVPTSVFVDTAGVVRLVVTGPLNSASLERGLAAILPTH